MYIIGFGIRKKRNLYSVTSWRDLCMTKSLWNLLWSICDPSFFFFLRADGSPGFKKRIVHLSVLRFVRNKVQNLFLQLFTFPSSAIYFRTRSNIPNTPFCVELQILFFFSSLLEDCSWEAEDGTEGPKFLSMDGSETRIRVVSSVVSVELES